MTRGRRIALTIVLSWIAVTALGSSGIVPGCSSATLPPEPTHEQMARVRSTHFATVVGVERSEPEVYGIRLIDALGMTGLFDEVGPLDGLADATLVARVERGIHGTAAIPIATGLSLGFIPTIVQEEWGESFSLRRRGSDDAAVAVEFSYEGPSTLGWWAAIQGLSPDVTTGNPRETDRFHDAFAAVICEQGDGIRRLLAPE